MKRILSEKGLLVWVSHRVTVELLNKYTINLYNRFVLLFFWLDPKEPKDQGYHCESYKFASRS